MDVDHSSVAAPMPGDKSERVYKSRSRLILDNFLGGIAWSLGTFIGFGAVAVVIGYFLSQVNLIPIIGSWVADILKDAGSRIGDPGNFD
ncbi:MAG TPA: DUF5665 domain-containing protein [Patescibacteria group bacterium]